MKIIFNYNFEKCVSLPLHQGIRSSDDVLYTVAWTGCEKAKHFNTEILSTQLFCLQILKCRKT